MSHPFEYSDKRVVITGAFSGVGAACLDVLKQLGASEVIALDIKRPEGPISSFIETGSEFISNTIRAPETGRGLHCFGCPEVRMNCNQVEGPLGRGLSCSHCPDGEFISNTVIDSEVGIRGVHTGGKILKNSISKLLRSW